VIRLGRSFWWVLLVTSASYFISRLPWLIDNPIFIRLTAALLVLLAVSFIWTSVSLWKISLIRSTRTMRKQVGEVFLEDFSIHNGAILPKLWIKVTDQATLKGGKGSKVITGIGAKQSWNYVAFTPLNQRGWFTLGPTRVESGDIFGLFLAFKTFESQMRLLVIPFMVDIQFFLAPFGILPGGHTKQEKTLEVTPYAAGVREYVAGDPLKRIHWPSSARKQVLIVKEFEKDPLAEVWIFLDSRSGVHIRSDESGFPSEHPVLWVRNRKVFKLPPDTAEYAISIAASIAKYYIGQKREVGLISAGQSYTVLPPEKGERQMGKILETLAVIEPEGELPLWALVSSQISNLSRGSTVLLITPASDDKILTVSMELIHRGLIPVLILIDQSGFGGVGTADQISAKLSNHGVINFVVQYGDDIKAVLETPQAVFDPRSMFHSYR